MKSSRNPDLLNRKLTLPDDEHCQRSQAHNQYKDYRRADTAPVVDKYLNTVGWQETADPAKEKTDTA